MPAAKFACEVCGRLFTRLSDLICFEYISDLHMDLTPFSQTCGKTFNRGDSYLSHIRNHQEPSNKKIIRF